MTENLNAKFPFGISKPFHTFKATNIALQSPFLTKSIVDL